MKAKRVLSLSLAAIMVAMSMLGCSQDGYGFQHRRRR